MNLQMVNSIQPTSQVQRQVIALATSLASKGRNSFSTMRNLMRSAIQAHFNRLTT